MKKVKSILLSGIIVMFAIITNTVKAQDAATAELKIKTSATLEQKVNATTSSKPMLKLQEMHNTVVNARTRDEYREILQIYNCGWGGDKIGRAHV